MGAIALNVELAPVDSSWEVDDVGPLHLVTLELAVTWDCAPGEPLTERHQLGPFVDDGRRELDCEHPAVADALEALYVADDLTGADVVRVHNEALAFVASLDRAEMHAYSDLT